MNCSKLTQNPEYKKAAENWERLRQEKNRITGEEYAAWKLLIAMEDRFLRENISIPKEPTPEDIKQLFTYPPIKQ